MDISNKTKKNDSTSYFTKQLAENYMLMKDLEYRLKKRCLKECIDLEAEVTLSLKEKKCLQTCNDNISNFFKISAENYENAEKVHTSQSLQEIKKRLTTDDYD